MRTGFAWGLLILAVLLMFFGPPEISVEEMVWKGVVLQMILFGLVLFAIGWT